MSVGHGNSILSGHQKMGIGLGLRSTYFERILRELPRSVDWFEAITENFIGIQGSDGGRPLEILLEIREHYPIVLHGVGLSLGSTDPLNRSYLGQLKSLADSVQPEWISDHCCWTGTAGRNLHDLLPLPFTSEALNHVAERIRQTQDFLGRRILIENVSSYVRFRHSEMPEWEFVNELARRSDCGLLLDINNVFVSAANHGFQAMDYLRGIDADRVGQFHLAGHTKENGVWIDTHDQPICPEVWSLYAEALKRFGCVPTLVEWDANFPEFSFLESELDRARAIQKAGMR